MSELDENLQNVSEETIKHLQKEIKKVNKRFLLLIAVCTFTLIGIYILCNYIYSLKQENKEYKTTIAIQESELSLDSSIGYWFINTPTEINDSILYEFLIENNAWYPEILLKQAKIESSNYTSSIYKSNHNLYGMKKVYKRQTTQHGELNGYGVYDNWCLSVLDRLLWDMFTFKNVKPTKEEYLNALKRANYATDPDYIKKLL